jgi:hypothetical protein
VFHINIAKKNSLPTVTNDSRDSSNFVYKPDNKDFKYVSKTNNPEGILTKVNDLSNSSIDLLNTQNNLVNSGNELVKSNTELVNAMTNLSHTVNESVKIRLEG